MNVASILDTYITVPEMDLAKAGIVEAVAKAIGDAANVHLGVGTCLACGAHPVGPEPTVEQEAERSPRCTPASASTDCTR
jgi:hypothetical protein